jgi:hypothetical protein
MATLIEPFLRMPGRRFEYDANAHKSNNLAVENYAFISFMGQVPVGAILPYAGFSAPPGFLLCDGSAVSRQTYAALFSVIGTTYGAGDGSTTFNLPNLIGTATAHRVPGGSSTTNSIVTVNSGATGTNTVTSIGVRYIIRTGVM